LTPGKNFKEEKMSLTVNTNIASLTAQRNLVGTNRSLQTSMARLSSGLRINSAKDDAAGLAISDKMTTQIRGMNQAVRNANDGISMAQTAEGAIQESTNLLQRMRELAVQAANGTYGDEERASLNDEFNQLQQEISRIATSTEFNGKQVLMGSMDGTTLQVGANAGDTITITLGTSAMTASGLGVALRSTTTSYTYSGSIAVGSTTTTTGIGITTASAATSALSLIDAALNTIDTFRGKLGAIQSRLESTVSNLMNISENTAAARSRIMDADFAAETANLTRAQILQQAGVAMLSQANAIPQTALALLQ
jgi:flagellin